jgi:NAD dependent epimerase/dehydratase family enzyme
MRIVIAGGSGNVGSMLARAYHERADNVIVLSRQSAAAPWKTVYWDGRSIGPWVSELDGADVVVNLAGRSVNCRYTAKNRREILSSRVESTRIIGSGRR